MTTEPETHAKRTAAPKKPGVKLPGFLAKVPLPYLGGAAAGVVMVLFVVVKAAMTPMPVPVQQQAPVEQQQPGQPAQAAAPAAPAPQETAAPVNPPSAAAPEIAPGVTSGFPVMNRMEESNPLKELGRRVKMSKEEFDAQTTLYETDQLDGVAALAYRIRIPQNWTAMTSTDLQARQMDAGFSGVLAYYVSPPELDLRSSVRIRSEKLAYTTNAVDWLRNYATNNRYTLQAISGYGADRAEAVYLITDRGITYVIRVVVVLNGTRAVVAEYLVPMDKYEDQKDIQTWAMTSFYLKNIDSEPQEIAADYDVRDFATIQYPEKWLVQNQATDSIDRARVSLAYPQLGPDGRTTVLQGRIDLYAFVNTVENTPEVSFEQISSRFAAQGLRLGSPIATFVPTQNTNGLRVADALVYPVTSDAGTYQNYQYWLVRLASAGRNYYLGLLTPPLSLGMEGWLRNHGAFDYVVANFKETRP